MTRSGILVGGNWIIDRVKIIDKFPVEESLVNILEEYSSNGGAAYNVLKDLAKMQAPFSLEAIGLVGQDPLGRSILNECHQLSVDIRQLGQTAKASTSYTDVMSVQSTGKRTFFHQRGANALLDAAHFDFSASGAKLFHLGYLLLLDRLDLVDSDGRTGASRILEQALDQGFMTSVDIVSEDSLRFKKIVPSSLPFIDYLFVNEFEAGMLTSGELSRGGVASAAACMEAARHIQQMGVRRWVIVHFPEGAIALSKNGECLYQPSVRVPSGKIGGAVGAGDAFAAGVLLAVHEGWGMQQALKLGVCAAASSLQAVTCSDSVMPYPDCLALADTYGYRPLVAMQQ